MSDKVCCVCGSTQDVNYHNHHILLVCLEHSKLSNDDCFKVVEHRNNKVLNLLGIDIDGEVWAVRYFPSWWDNFQVTFEEFLKDINKAFAHISTEYMYNNYY